MRFVFSFLSLAFALAAFPGCYSLGAHGELPFSTVTVMPVKSEIDFAGTQALLAKNIIEAINAEPGITTKTEGGSAELFVTLTKINRSTSVSGRYDAHVNTVEKISITASVSLRDVRGNGWYFKDRPVTADIQVYLSDLNSAQSYPAVSRELARRIKDQIVSVW